MCYLIKTIKLGKGVSNDSYLNLESEVRWFNHSVYYSLEFDPLAMIQEPELFIDHFI